MTEPSRHTEIGECIAGRYRIEELLGRGGMATVYRALDLRTERHCALKRGWAGDARKTQRRGALLEREYHTLAQLAHPRIIEVYEYGVDERGPFYTMELLAGTDLDAGGRLPWKQACALLHDVASSLAILHARGLLHRDLSLRNIRCTPEGRAKLIDFGAMAPMGVAKDVQGTAPFIAPEVLQMQELDARADLFALGAVGYYLLTGRTAFPARRMHELRDVWRSRPAPPSRLVPELPPALSALIVQLLALDRGARPKSAAEVMERLCTIAGLPREEHVEVSRAYLATPALVGRDAVLVQARREILSLVRREGGTLLVEGPSGSGRSRMLDACVLEGKLLGMTVVRADAGDAAEGDWGVARALCNQLGALLPDVAAEAARLSRDVLAQVLDHGELAATATATATAPQSERSLLLRELREYVLSFVRRQPLLFVIDDVDEIDEPSAALLAAIAHKAKRNPLLLVLALEREQGPSSSAPLRLLRLVAKRVELEPLRAEQCEALLQSIFGEAPHLPVVAARVHELAQGNPRAILDVAQHLVERGLARYSAGSWLLPARLEEHDLPATLSAALDARLEGVGPDARALAEVQAVADGEALDVGGYAELSRIDEHKRIFAALDELVSARVFRLDGDGYRFSQRGFVGLVREQLSGEAARALHARVADRLRHVGGDVLRRADHLLHAQRGREAIELLNSVNLQVALPSVALLECAIAEAEQLAVPARTLQRLREAVVAKASVVLAVESLQRHLPKVLEQLERDSGLSAYRERTDLPHAERLQQALLETQQRYLATPEEQRVYSPIDAIRELARLNGSLCAFALQSYDSALLDSLPSLEPLQSLSPALAIMNQVVAASKHWVSGRPHKYAEIARQILERIAQPGDGGLDAVQHRRTRLGLTYGLGLMEAGTGSTRAEARAALVEHDRDYRVPAWRIRMVMHLKQGNLEEAQRCERRAELLFLQEHGSRSYESMSAGAEVAARAEAGDLLGVKSSVETLAILADRHAGWRPAYLAGLSRYRWLHGDLEGALAAIVDAVALAPPGRHNAFVGIAAGHVRTLGELGRVEEAAANGKHYLAVCEREDLSMFRETLQAAVAPVLAAAGEEAEAIALIESAIETAERTERVGLALGSLYEIRARIAIRMGNPEAFARAAERCAAEYQKAKNAALSARFARLLEDACQHEVSEAGAADEYRELLQQSEAESEYNTVHSRMLECVDAGDRARCALSLLLASTDSNAGYLFGVRERRAVLLAALPEQLADAELRDWVDECLQSALGSDEIVTAESTGDGTLSTGLLRYTDPDGQAFQPVFLIAGPEQQSEMAAVLVVQVRPGVRCVPSNAMLRELARELLEHGDVNGVQLSAARFG